MHMASDNRICLIMQFENNDYHKRRKNKKEHFESYTVSNSHIIVFSYSLLLDSHIQVNYLFYLKMHQTEIIFSVLVISAFTVSAQDYNVTITFQEKNCEIDCFEIHVKFADGHNFTKKENNLTDIVRTLQRQVNHNHDADTSQETTSSTIYSDSMTTGISEHGKAQGTGASDANNSSGTTKSSNPELSKAATSPAKHAQKSTETTTAKSTNLTTPHKELGKPLNRSHDAKTGILITLTVVIIIIAGAWVGRKYYRRGTSESYFLLR